MWNLVSPRQGDGELITMPHTVVLLRRSRPQPTAKVNFEDAQSLHRH